MGARPSLKPITHPLRADLPFFWVPRAKERHHDSRNRRWLAAPLLFSVSARSVRGSNQSATAAHFEIMQDDDQVTDDIEAGLQSVKEGLALYVDGSQRNFHNELMARMGFEAEAKEIQSLYLSGRKDEAVAAVPTNSRTKFL